MKLLSFVIPCYRSEHTIEKVTDEIIDVVSGREEYDYEIIAVNDASPDRVYDTLRDLARQNPKIKAVNLARNMGKHSAVLAGYSVAEGDYIVNLDDDFQSPVYELWNMLEPIERDECDVTTAKYRKKRESVLKRFGSNVNLWISEIMLDKPKGLRFENFSVMKRFICDEVIKYQNPYPYLEGLIVRVTRRIQTVPMENRERADDQASGFSFRKSIALFVNGFTSFSVKPLRIAAVLGFLFALFGFLYSMYIVIKKILIPEVPVGYSSVMAVMLFSSGLIMLVLGMIGEYIGRIFICINNSPQFVIKETINVERKR
ncbi:glycosyltransferase [Clostridiaceae bacterium]|nr:glycosyltransferase [Clostridiaceae bacterium]